MGALLQRIKEWWAGADRTQKLISTFGAAFLVVLVVGTVMLSSRTRMEPVAPGATPAEQSAIRDAVVSYGFPASFENGQVMAPAKNISEIRAKLAQDGKLASGGPVGMNALSGGNMFDTPAVEAERIRFAAQGELAQTIMKYQGVQDATVHINGGRKSAFVNEGDPASAVVTISPKPGWDLGPRDGKAIAQIVQLAVSGLKPEGVSVIANNGQILYDGAEANSGDAVATRKIEAEASESKRREKDLQRRLDQAFGPGATIAMVQVELNMDEISEEEHIQTPGKPIAKTSLTETLSGDTPTTGQSNGTAEANVLAAPPTSSSANRSYASEQEDAQYAVNEKTISTKKASGYMLALNVNVLVDTNKVKDSTTVKGFVDGLLTTAQERNFRATVTEAAFSDTVAKAAEKAASGAASANMMQQVMGFLPIVALLIVGLVLVKSLAASLKSRNQVTLSVSDGGTLSLPYSPSLEALIGGTGGGSTPIDADQLLALTSATAQRHEDDNDFSDAPEFIGEIKQRIDVPLEQIRKLSKEKPEMVALLLKTWMMEEM
jgi:flagellar biosynthesis/type III secretory pathway M-ring protein FliF/YscJ